MIADSVRTYLQLGKKQARFGSVFETKSSARLGSARLGSLGKKLGSARLAKKEARIHH